MLSYVVPHNDRKIHFLPEHRHYNLGITSAQSPTTLCFSSFYNLAAPTACTAAMAAKAKKPIISVPSYQPSCRDRNLGRARGWTQVEVSELLGIDRSYLSEIETGKKNPSLTILKTIADGFGLSLAQLLRNL